MILFDTNVLVYSQDKNDSRYKICRAWVKKAQQKEVNAFLSPQNIVEFSSVVIKLKNIKKIKLDIEEIKEAISIFQNDIFQMIYPNPIVLTIYQRLLNDHFSSTKKFFDVFLAATMLSNGVNQILTYNTKDFVEFKEIKAISPESCKI